jgi:guanylate kinase
VPPDAPSPTAPRLVVISGPSGVGKTTVAERLLRDPRVGRALTATTRLPRGGERDGVDYRFLAPQDFEAGLARGEFLEHARVYGSLYGTPRDGPGAVLRSGRHCLLVVDVQGVTTLRGLGVEALYVFLRAPSPEELLRRLRSRGLDGPEAQRRRTAEAAEEAARAESFDLVLVNESVEETARRLAAALGVDLGSP